ncbi:MAG: DUF933 domain-containing protein [Candidatus Omnitrophica bacterium]|nr:DUF933 domain-containing protein [Candidatus Omnitrophota bacterium]
MKISVFSISTLAPGKYNIKDPRLDAVDKIVKAKKKTYVQMELVSDQAVFEADALLALEDMRSDLILRDLEFVETRLGRSADEKEKELLLKLKNALEKEQFLFNAGLSNDEIQAMASYSLVTLKPVVMAKQEETDIPNDLLARALKESGYLSFFTAGEKETRAWMIKKGTSAWEAAGVIHSDIQKGFIRAEIISYDDYINAGGETPAKQQGKMRLEPKEYMMQDCDLANFRFNK